MIVKICGITNLDDALAAVDGGAQALGFNLYARSPRYLDPAAAARITARLPERIWKAGVFVNETPARVAELMREAGLDIAQLHGDEPPSAVPAGARVWKAFRVAGAFTAESLAGYGVEAVLLDGPAELLYGGAGKTFAWEVARGLGHKVIVAGGLDASNVAAAIERAQPWGVDACSRLESSPGRKDRRKLAAFLKAALG